MLTVLATPEEGFVSVTNVPQVPKHPETVV